MQTEIITKKLFPWAMDVGVSYDFSRSGNLFVFFRSLKITISNVPLWMIISSRENIMVDSHK